MNLVAKKRGSNNRRRAREDLARLHLHVANQRKDWQFKLARRLCETYDTICIVEDPHFGGRTEHKGDADAMGSQSERFGACTVRWYFETYGVEAGNDPHRDAKVLPLVQDMFHMRTCLG